MIEFAAGNTLAKRLSTAVIVTLLFALTGCYGGGTSGTGVVDSLSGSSGAERRGVPVEISGVVTGVRPRAVPILIETLRSSETVRSGNHGNFTVEVELESSGGPVHFSVIANAEEASCRLNLPPRRSVRVELNLSKQSEKPAELECRIEDGR